MRLFKRKRDDEALKCAGCGELAPEAELECTMCVEALDPKRSVALQAPGGEERSTRSSRGRALALALSLLGLALLPATNASAQGGALDAYGEMPLSFAPNVGQTDERVGYVAQGAGYSFFFADAEAMLSFAPGADDVMGSSGGGVGLRLLCVGVGGGHEAASRATGTVNRLTGSGDGQSDVPTYEKLIYRELWPNIDLAIHGQGGELRYEFHLRPGADPRDIRLAYAGADGLAVGSDGDMVIDTPLGDLTDARPVAYQELDGRYVAVESRHAIQGQERHGFALDGSYDRSRPLVIGAALTYSTYLGAAGSDSGRGVAVDGLGSVYVTGQTASSTFPTTPGAYDRAYNQNVDAFVTKFDATGSRIVYSTFVGGTAFDSGNGIAVDEDGAAYVAGFTGSTNFPTTAGAHDPTHNGGSDAFVLKLSPEGNALEYSSYLGAGGFSFDGANGIAVDDEGSAYVTGFAGGGTFPTTPGVHDASHNGRNDVYVTKFDPSGSALAYSTFVGGTLLDTGTGVAVDSEHNAYVTGFTASADFPTSPDAPDRTHNGGVNDAFVAKLDAAGSTLAYSTFLGGTGSDSGQGIAVDEKGKAAHVTGSTASADFPTTGGAFDVSYNGNGDAFVTRFDRAGSSLDYSTFLGGAAEDAGLGIAVDEKGRTSFLTGSTSSSDYLTSTDANDPSYNGTGDGILTKLALRRGVGAAAGR
jgi:hypothetical protein